MIYYYKKDGVIYVGLALIGWIGIAILMLILSLAFKVAGKLRLTIPLAYLLIVSFGGGIFFPEWVDENEPLLLLGLYILIALVVISWIYSLVKAIRERRAEKRYNEAFKEDVAWQIQRARELGIKVGAIRIQEDGTVVHADTGEPILPL